MRAVAEQLRGCTVIGDGTVYGPLRLRWRLSSRSAFACYICFGPVLRIEERMAADRDRKIGLSISPSCIPMSPSARIRALCACDAQNLAQAKLGSTVK